MRGRLGKKAIEKRVSQLGESWQNRTGRVAWNECGLACPVDDGYFTLHAVRNARGAGIYSTLGVTAAAQWLGDSEQSVRGHYGFLDGTTLTQEDMRRAAGAGRTASVSTNNALLRNLKDAGVTDEQISRALNAAFGS